MHQDVKTQVRDLIQSAEYEAAARILKQQGDDPEAMELFDKLKRYVRQQRAKEAQQVQPTMPEPVIQEQQPIVDNPQTPEEYLAFVRQLIADKRYIEAEAILERMQNNPTAKEMLITLRGIMDVVSEKKKRVNDYSGRLTTERIVTNIAISLIFVLIFRNINALVAAGVYWVYDLTIAPPGKLNLWHVGAAIILAIGLTIACGTLPFLLSAGTEAGYWG